MRTCRLDRAVSRLQLLTLCKIPMVPFCVLTMPWSRVLGDGQCPDLTKLLQAQFEEPSCFAVQQPRCIVPTGIATPAEHVASFSFSAFQCDRIRPSTKAEPWLCAA